MPVSSVDKVLQQIRHFPRLALNNVKPFRESLPQKNHGLKRKKRGLGHRGFSQFQSHRPIGMLERKTPFYIKVPMEPYNEGHQFRRQLPRISLLELQRLIDLNRIEPGDPIDLTTICNTKLYSLDIKDQKQYGFHLTEEGLDCFAAKVNIEVQFASEAVIAAVERNGGTILTRFYDLLAVRAKMDPEAFFLEGAPIPRCRTPPLDAVDYYRRAENRGYLADPEEIGRQRAILAQKFGYELPDLAADPQGAMLAKRKHARQIFFDLEPGWVVNLRDRTVLKPTDPSALAFYRAE